MALAISYIRFSCVKQVSRDSLRRQLAETERYCQRENLTLDSMSYRDLAVSGYLGNNVRNGALALFLEAVKQGRIASGTVLIVEAIDRLSRDEMDSAYELFRNILKSGIDIVTLQPERRYTSGSLNSIFDIMEPLLYMQKAHEHSANLSYRISKHVKEVRRKARENATVLKGKKNPFWIKNVGGILTLDTKKTHLLKQIYQWLIEGYGFNLVAQKLNAMGELTPIAKKAWSNASVRQLIMDRASIGEYQPKTRTNYKRVNDGDPIKDYYPAAITEETYYEALNAIAKRRSGGGRKDNTTILGSIDDT